MRAIEFYTTPEGNVTIREQGQPERQLKESDTDFIQHFLEVLEEFYPEAYASLRKYYARYDGNKCYRDFLAVRRFIKCNFGLYDNMIDVDENWNFRFEFVGCPLRRECPEGPGGSHQLRPRPARIRRHGGGGGLQGRCR